MDAPQLVQYLVSSRSRVREPHLGQSILTEDPLNAPLRNITRAAATTVTTLESANPATTTRPIRFTEAACGAGAVSSWDVVVTAPVADEIVIARASLLFVFVEETVVFVAPANSIIAVAFTSSR